MLNLIGLGLRGIKSLTLEQLEVLKLCDLVYFETYTSISPQGTIRELESLLGKEVLPADREQVENQEELIRQSVYQNVSIVVTGDPLSATTHNQLRFDCLDAGIEVRVFENASIISVIPGKVGLFPYRMGPPVSVPFPQDNFLPKSVAEKIAANLAMNQHTILLLDLKDGRTMFPHEALNTILQMEERYGFDFLKSDSKVFSLSRVSQEGERLIYDTVSNIILARYAESPASIVIPAKLNHNEEAFAEKFTKKSQGSPFRKGGDEL